VGTESDFRVERALKACNGDHLPRLTRRCQFTSAVWFAGSAVGAGSLHERRNEDSCLNRGDTDGDPTADQPQRMGKRLLRGLHGAGSLAHSSRRYRQLDGACWSGRTARLRGLRPRSHRGRPSGLRSAPTALERRNRSSSRQAQVAHLTPARHHGLPTHAGGSAEAGAGFPVVSEIAPSLQFPTTGRRS